MKRISLAIPLLLLWTSCKVGPDYETPLVAMPSEYVEEYIEDREESTYDPYDEDFLYWWMIFNDPFLNELLDEATRGSFDYRIAIEQVYQARAQYWMQFTQILPEFDFDTQASRFRASQAFTTSSTASTPRAAAATAGISPIQNFFQIGFDCVWELDLFGKLRRTADAAYDTWQATCETSRDVKIIVLSEVASTYAQICAFQKRETLALEIVDDEEKFFELLSDKFTAGLSSEIDVENIRVNLETDRAALKAIQILLRQSIYSLAILLGRDPESLADDFSIKREIPIARGKIPAGLPADLLRRRHDIRSAERNMAAATEQIGVAVAQLYPSVSLTGSSSSFAANPLQGANIGYSTDTASRLFTSPARIWGIGALLTVPVFDFGKRLAGIEVQLALQNQACLTFQKTVVTALQEVEDAFAAYFNEREREKSLTLAAEANKRIYDLTRDQYESGLAGYDQVLQSKDIWLNSVSTLTDSQQALTTDLIAVYKSLGGDW